MKTMQIEVSVPDDTIEHERLNHGIICDEIRGAILDCMILDSDNQADNIEVRLISIK